MTTSIKLFFSCCLILLVTPFSNAQVGIGTSNVEPSARLQVDADNRGFLPPRMTTIQRNAIPSPATGLLIYNTTTGRLEVRTSSAWVSLSSLASADVSGTLPVANGGTGTTTSTGTESVVLSTSPTLTTPIIGTTTASSGAGAVRYSTSSGGILEYSNGTNWNALSSTVQRANVYATRLSPPNPPLVFTVNNNATDYEFAGFTSSSGAGGTNFNSSTGVYTAPRSGLYTVSAGMSFKMLAASSSGVFHFLVMKGGISGTEVCNQALPINYPINSILSANISCSVPLNAGETIQIKYHNWTGTQIEVSLSQSFQGRYYFTVTEN